MDVAEARTRSIQGAINGLENEIGKATDKGLRLLDTNDFDGVLLSDEVFDHFKSKGFTVQSGVIKW